MSKNACKLILATVFVVISFVCHANLDGALVVGTYKYNDIDRQSAIVPLAESLESVANSAAKVVVYDTPSDLANAFFANEIDVAVPNLAGFAKIAAKSDSYLLLVVPDNDRSSYTSSILSSQVGTALQTLVKSTKKPIGMVWPDSSSGGVLGTAKLMEYFNQDEAKLHMMINYLGSHQNVIDALLTGDVDIGVAATNVYMQNANKDQLNELWRSPVIPFGPVICQKVREAICTRLRALMMQNNAQAAKVLAGLKLGWVEFASATKLVTPDPTQYAIFIEHYKK